MSRLESGRAGKLTLDVVGRIASAVGVRTELVGRWQGGDGDRLLNWRHSLLAERVCASLRTHEGWRIEPEVSLCVRGERGVVDQLGWHEASSHLLVVELKTEFVDFNETLGTLDRKVRLAPAIAAERGWRPKRISVWLIVSDTRTNRRHAAGHASLLRTKFPLDGRSLPSFLNSPVTATFGLAFWPDSHPRNLTNEAGRILTRVRVPKPAANPSLPPGGPNPGP